MGEKGVCVGGSCSRSECSQILPLGGEHFLHQLIPSFLKPREETDWFGMAQSTQNRQKPGSEVGLGSLLKAPVMSFLEFYFLSI